MLDRDDQAPRPPERSEDRALAPGAALGAFTIEAQLAAGGFGTVFRARDSQGAPVAVKVLHAHLAASAATVARFEREARAAASLAHPGIVAVLGDGRLPDGRPWFAMELLEGRELEERIRVSGPLAPAECRAIMDAIADALTAAHEHGIIHRDIKASNVFLAPSRVVLLDFGVAKLLDLGDEHLTLTGTAVGTPASMAPEQARGGPVDARTDVYGLGALLFHMLTGEKPFGGHATEELRFLHQHARRPRPSSRARVPASLDAVVARSMAIDPAARYATPAAFAAALAEAVTGAVAAPLAATPSEPLGEPLFLLAELATVDGSLAAPSDELWLDVEAVRTAFHDLARPPYRVRAVTDTSILVERRVAPGAAAPASERPDHADGGEATAPDAVELRAATLDRMIDDCADLARRLRERPTRHPAVRIRLVVDVRPDLPPATRDPDPSDPVVIHAPARSRAQP